MVLVLTAVLSWPLVAGLTGVPCTSEPECKVVTAGGEEGLYLRDLDGEQCGTGCKYRRHRDSRVFCLADDPAGQHSYSAGHPGHGSCPGPEACTPCCSTPGQYVNHLQAVMDKAVLPSKICPDAQLMSRIQTINPNEDGTYTLPEQLSKYGTYWSFASGPDVLDFFLSLAQAEERGLDMLKKMVFHLGFDAKTVDGKVNRNASFNLVVFDKESMNSAWKKLQPAHFQGVFQPSWVNLGKYLWGDTFGFQVCSSAWHTPPDSCTRERLDIATDLGYITKRSYQELTGCDRTALKCEYETWKESFETPEVRAGGSPSCVAKYKENPFKLEDFQHAQWTRAFFEVCWGCSPYFTGSGLGYDPVGNLTTGSEWIVRGDSQLPISQLAAASTALWPMD